MKRLMASLILALWTVSLVIAAGCDPAVSLINQDPYPAVPGEKVDLVFQIDGLSSSECGNVQIELESKFPFTVDPSTPAKIDVRAGTYTSTNYESFVMAPYKVRVDEDALDGDTPIELTVTRTGGTESYSFDVNIEDTRVDFEVYIKDYNYDTRELTLEILNIGKSDVEAVTLEIPNQENIDVNGASRVTVGDVDSNEYTTADFEAIMSDGDFDVDISYSDAVNVRRHLTKTLKFDSSYFTNRAADQTTTSIWTYLIWAAIIIAVVYFLWRRYRKKKNKK